MIYWNYQKLIINFSDFQNSKYPNYLNLIIIVILFRWREAINLKNIEDIIKQEAGVVTITENITETITKKVNTVEIGF